MKTIVSQWRQEKFERYPDTPPYNPSEKYPEYDGEISADYNAVYEAFRNAMLQLGLDKENYGKVTWNPLGYLIKPGNSVVIKPNFVLHHNEGKGTILSVITNPSLIRAVVDYVYKALQGRGLIIIGDASQADCDYDKVLEMTNVSEIAQYYKERYNFEIEIDDFRQMKYVYHNGVLDEKSRTIIDGDPRGYTIFNLEKKSFIDTLENPERIYGADYDRKEVVQHHSGGKHEYCVSSTVINADVVISMPKMKTHKKSGVTINLKNLVGINGNKNYLPHFRIGDPSQGGDEFEPLKSVDKIRKNASRTLIDKLMVKPNPFKSFIYKSIRNTYIVIKPLIIKKKAGEKDINAGCWFGNDTIWRMVLDLNLIFWHGTKDGIIDESFERKLFCVVDGFVAGEGEGPMAPDDRIEGIVTIGENPFAVDLACINAMGFDYNNIPLYKAAEEYGIFGISDIEENVKILSNVNVTKPFLEPIGWKGKMVKENQYNGGN